MNESTSPLGMTLEMREQVSSWFEQPLGRSLLACEAERLRALLPGLYASNVLQLGRLGGIDLFESCNAPQRFLLESSPVSGDSGVRALPESLPFEHNSIDMVLLPHTLDFCLDPHPVLREVERVLMPESHIVILGFNPYSFWGLKRSMIRRSRRHAPWNGHFIGVHRMKDWLKLLQFEVTHGSMMYYRPPLQKSASLDRFRVLDKLGDRWWPMMGGAYLLAAKKRVEGMTPIQPRWKLSVVRSGKAAPEAATRGIAAKKPDGKQALG